MNTANVRVISEATLPEKTWPPRGLLVLLVAALLGAAAGASPVLIPALTGRPGRRPVGQAAEARG